MEAQTKNRQTTSELLEETQGLIQRAKDFLVAEGKVVELEKFLTIKRYCEKHEIKNEAVVTNWIRRGVVPAEDIAVIEELNGLRMIRDRRYK
ncbi:hypothetical protein [Persicitalea sp.]|uniref:hypothetical protein n=1 Tax=Persicitalea sp. TaxID=3100273 RepID=UPI00359454DE